MRPFVSRFFLILIVPLAAGSLGYSQTDGSIPPEDLQSGSTQTLPDWTVSVNCDTNSLDLLSEHKVNMISGGFSLTGSYDDNALNASGTGVGNAGMLFSPSVSVYQSRSRTFLTFNYFPGFTLNERLSPRYDIYQDSDFNLQFRLTEHATVRLHDSFLYGTSSFDQPSPDSSLSGQNILHQTNASVVTPLTNRLNNLGGADVVYHVAENTMVGASGNFSNLHFQQTATDTQLLDNQAQSADAFYQKTVSEHQAIGLTYTFQHLTTFGSPTENTITQSALLFDSISFTPSITLSVFAGPDRVSSGLGGISHTGWYTDGGVTFGWQGQRSSTRVGFIHHVADGGGLTGAVSAYSVVSGARQKFGANWTANLEIVYGHNTPLNSTVGDVFSSVIGNAGLERKFGQKLAITVAYGREHQMFGARPTLGLSDHNREWVSISYRFQRPFGR